MDTSSYYIIEDGEIELNAGNRYQDLTVANTGDRPIQIGSHAHFFEVNRALRFDRRSSFGMRLDIPAGTAVRFEPGDSKPVRLVAFGGLQLPCGMSGLTDSDIEADNAFRRAVARGFVLEPLR